MPRRWETAQVQQCSAEGNNLQADSWSIKRRDVASTLAQYAAVRQRRRAGSSKVQMTSRWHTRIYKLHEHKVVTPTRTTRKVGACHCMTFARWHHKFLAYIRCLALTMTFAYSTDSFYKYSCHYLVEWPCSSRWQAAILPLAGLVFMVLPGWTVSSEGGCLRL